MSSVPGSAPGPTLTSDHSDAWHRVHPVSPLVRSWVAIAAIVFIFGQNMLEAAFTPGRDGPSYSGMTGWIVLGLVGVAVLVLGGVFYLSWRFTRYQVTAQRVNVNSGVIFRQQRSARIDRVQAIDVVQPLLARLFGLAELKFDVADGGKSAMRLAFLKLGEAQRLRAEILARAAGDVADPDTPVVVLDAPETPVLALSPGRVIGAAVFGGLTIAALLLFAVIAGLVVWTGELGIIASCIPGFLALGAGYWQSITGNFNFRVGVSRDGVRLHYGLLETRSQTIPPGRVQAVGISQGPLWRIFGWYKVRVNVAGFAAEAGENGSRSVLLPAGTLAEVMTVLSLVFPDPGVEQPFEVFSAGLRGPATREGFVHSPPSARWIDPLAWRYNAVRATDTALLCRHGVFFRRLQVVPHERTQSLSLKQGPLMAVLGLVDVELHSTTGAIRPIVHHMALATGQRLFDEQAARAATARRIHRDEPWGTAPAHSSPTLLEEEHGR